MSKEWTKEQLEKAAEQVVARAYKDSEEESPDFDHSPWKKRDLKRALSGEGFGVGSDVAIELRLELNEALSLLGWMADEEPCRLDHHGYCQTHYLSESPCYMPILREWLARNRTLEVK